MTNGTWCLQIDTKVVGEFWGHVAYLFGCPSGPAEITRLLKPADLIEVAGDACTVCGDAIRIWRKGGVWTNKKRSIYNGNSPVSDYLQDIAMERLTPKQVEVLAQLFILKRKGRLLVEDEFGRLTHTHIDLWGDQTEEIERNVRIMVMAAARSLIGEEPLWINDWPEFCVEVVLSRGWDA